MEDNKQTTQVLDTPFNTNNEDNKGGKTFSQVDLDNLAGKIRGEEKTKTEQIVANAIAEYERKAKLTEEEREKEIKSKRESELKLREDEITLRERKIQAQELLASKNIPADLVDFVVNIDENITTNNIEKLAKTYNKSVENGVTNKLKGTPPVDFSNRDADNKSKKIMSAF